MTIHRDPVSGREYEVLSDGTTRWVPSPFPQPQPARSRAVEKKRSGGKTALMLGATAVASGLLGVGIGSAGGTTAAGTTPAPTVTKTVREAGKTVVEEKTPKECIKALDLIVDVTSINADAWADLGNGDIDAFTADAERVTQWNAKHLDALGAASRECRAKA